MMTPPLRFTPSHRLTTVSIKMACSMALLLAAPPRINAHARVATPLPATQAKSMPKAATEPTPKPTPEPAAKAASINFEPTEPILTPGSVVKLKASVIDQKGKLMEGGKVTWDIDPTDPEAAATARKYVKVVQGKDGATVLALSRNLNLTEQIPEFVGIMATSSTVPPVTGTVYVRLQFAQFRHLDARVELMGDKMVEDLFGKQVKKDFYVAIVHLRNKLGDMQNGGGEPVIASSDSIEVAVAFEEMPDDPKERQPVGSKKWTLIKNGEGHKNQSGCEVHPWVYRPYANDILESTVDRRDSTNWRTRALAIATSSSILASAVTAIAVPKPGSDLPVGLEKFSASLIPGFKEVFPSQKDFHRRSIQQFVMQPTEKIAYGSDFSKAIFFPKSSFRGFRPNANVRISSICPDFFKVETGVLRTGDASTQPINTVSGQVKVGDKPIPGVSITLNNPFVRRTTVTNSEGFYSIQSLPQGEYTMSLSSDLYKFDEQSFKLSGDQKQDVTGSVQTYTLSGEVKDRDNTSTPIPDATVTLAAKGMENLETKTDADGKFIFANLDANRKYTLTITKTGFEPLTPPLGETLARDTDLMILRLKKKATPQQTPGGTPPETPEGI